MVKRFLVNTALALFGITFAAGAFELAIRLLPQTALPRPLQNLIHVMAISSGQYYIEDPELRHTMKPGIDFQFDGKEFSFRMQTKLNFPHAGFRGGTLGGPVWGAAFGDSFTFGAGMNQEKTWVAHLAALAQRDVINFGVSGHGPFQYTRVFEKYGAPLRPKIVFYALYTNDLEDSVRFEQWSRGQTKKRMSFRRFMRQQSVTYNLIGNLTRSRKRKWQDEGPDNLGVKLLPRKLKSPYGVADHQFASAWTLVVQQIDRAIEACKRANATFVLLYFPSKEEVYWELARKQIKSIPGFEERIVRLQKTTSEFCQSRQILCLDLSPALKSRTLKGEILYFPIDIHWNEKGNRVVAEEIHKFLRDNRIIQFGG